MAKLITHTLEGGQNSFSSPPFPKRYNEMSGFGGSPVNYKYLKVETMQYCHYSLNI